MKKRNEKPNTGEGNKGKRVRTVSDDAGGKSLSDTSTSATMCGCDLHRCEVNCDTCLDTGNVRREFPVSSAHDCVQSVRKNIR